MKGRVLSVRHTGLWVRDLEASLYFYRALLGLEARSRTDESGSFLDEAMGTPGVRVTAVKLSAPEGGTLIELLHSAGSSGGDGPGQGVPHAQFPHIAMAIDDIDALSARLRDANVPFRPAARLSPNGNIKVLFCADPDGTGLELVQNA